MIGSNLKIPQTNSILPKSAENLYALISLINNPSEVKKILDKIQKKADEANVLISKVGDAKEIDRLLITADNNLTKSEEILQRNQSLADKLLEEAKNESELLLADSQSIINKAKEELKLEAKAIDIKVKNFSEELARANSKAKEVAAIDLALKGRELSVAAREEEVTRKENILSQLK